MTDAKFCRLWAYEKLPSSFISSAYEAEELGFLTGEFSSFRQEEIFMKLERDRFFDYLTAKERHSLAREEFGLPPLSRY